MADYTFEICMIVAILMIAFFIFVIYLSVKKNHCGELPPMDINYLYYNIQAQGHMRGWTVSVNPIGGKVEITKGSLVGTDMTFVQRPDGRISMFYTASSGALGWVLVILLIGTLFGSLIVGIWLHVASGKFTREEVIPAITAASGPIPVVQYN